MIKVHHLNNSRSQRVLWLLEELGTPYEVVRYARNPETNLAPPELLAVHPLGKSPVIEDGARVLAESGAIIEYLVGRYDFAGAFSPAAGSDAHIDYVYWMHFAEGSAMLPLLLKLYLGRLGDAAAPLRDRVTGQIRAQLDYMNDRLSDRAHFAGDAFSAADVQMSFPIEAAEARGGLTADWPHLWDWLARMRARPAYRRAIERGGPFELLR